mgnify:FL=1
MAVTQTTDITGYNLEMAMLTILQALRKTPILLSSAFATNPMLATQLLKSGEGGLAPHSLAIPNLAPLAAGSSVISDDPDQKITGTKITGGKSLVYPAFRAVSPQATGMSQHFGGYSITDYTQSQLATFWAGELETMLLSALNGVFAYNATTTDANHVQNSMIKDVSGTAYEKGVTNLCYETLLRAKAEIMGEQGDRIVCAVVHSVVAAGLGILTANQQQINIVPGANGSQYSLVNPVPLEFAGLNIIVSDSVPFVNGVATSYLLGEARLMAAMTPHDQPNLPALAVFVDQDAANGGGVIKVYSRTALAVHPVGFSFIPPVSGYSIGGPTAAQFATAANWQQDYEQKRIGLMAIKTREYEAV